MRIRTVLRHAVHMLTAFVLMASGSTVRAMENGNTVREIPFSSIEGVRIGNAQDDVAKTGVTVLCFPAGAKAGVDISIVLSGGSAYGLAAADGVMQCLEEHDIGFDTGFARVPLVVQSCIFDLSYGSAKVRPDKKMGYDACLDALNKGKAISGSVGAGTGATVGKLCGMGQSMKSGIGYHAVQIGELKVGAVVVLNALGDVYSVETGQKIAGLMNRERTSFQDSVAELYRISKPADLFNRTNTTVGAIVTNGNFDKAELTTIAGQTRNAFARAIKPVGTLADGDTIYASSCGKPVQADVNMAGTLAAEVMAKAIEKAIIASRMDDKKYLSHCLGLVSK